MTAVFEPDATGDEERFRELLSAGNLPTVEAPVDVIDQVRAKMHERLSVTTSIAPPRPQRFSRRARLVLAGLALSLAVIAVSLSLRSHAAWAQVADAVRSKPWIHMTATDPTGRSRELWFSFPRDVGVINDANIARYDDYRSGVRLEFDRHAKSLIKVPATDVETFESLSSFFRSLFRGDMRVGERLAEDRVVEQEKRTVVQDGTTWIEYELKLQRAERTVAVTVRVDPVTKLPVSMQFTAEKEQLRYTFDYPAAGPADIYALDVPRDTVVEDRVPAADLANIIQVLNTNRRELDNYVAVIVQSMSMGGSISRPERIVWRKGDKWRVELSSKLIGVESPGKDENIGAWVKKVMAQSDSWPLMVCDGHKVFRKDLGENAAKAWKVERTLAPGQGHEASRSFGDASGYMIEFEAFPEVMATAHSTVAFDPTGKGGPPDSVLVEISFHKTSERAYRKSRYWLDPQHLYAVVRTELSDCAALDNDPEVPPERKREIYEFGEFRQSPRGIWYPSLKVRKNASWDEAPAADGKPGTKKFYDILSYYYLDFEAELPDEMFTTAERLK